MDHLDQAAPHAATRETRDVRELEAADALAVEFDDQHFLVGIGIDGGQSRHVFRTSRRRGIVTGGDDAVFHDQIDEKRQVGGGGRAEAQTGQR